MSSLLDRAACILAIAEAVDPVAARALIAARAPARTEPGVSGTDGKVLFTDDFDRASAPDPETPLKTDVVSILSGLAGEDLWPESMTFREDGSILRIDFREPCLPGLSRALKAPPCKGPAQDAAADADVPAPKYDPAVILKDEIAAGLPAEDAAEVVRLQLRQRAYDTARKAIG